jgi:hypothetical protein
VTRGSANGTVPCSRKWRRSERSRGTGRGDAGGGELSWSDGSEATDGLPELNETLSVLVKGTRRIRGEEMIGAYLQGSFAVVAPATEILPQFTQGSWQLGARGVLPA